MTESRGRPHSHWTLARLLSVSYPNTKLHPDMASEMAMADTPASPSLDSISNFIATRTRMEIWLTLAAVLLPLFRLIITLHRRKIQQRNQKPFPFLELPQELRDMVYEYFLDDPVYPAPARQSYQTTSAVTTWMRPGRWTLTAPSTSSTPQRGSKWIFLANKQIYSEYMDMLCKRRTFYLNVSPQTYTPVDTSTTSNTPSPSSASQTPQDAPVWTISPATLSKIHHCSLNLITASSMLGVTDPRSMTSSSWTLGRRMREQLKHMSSIQSFTLDAKALGDPLWNPLWIWYHASQSLKLLGTDISDTVPKGPQLSQIHFSLDTWSPGENFLKRLPDQGWTWYCTKGHVVAADSGYEMTVREFCAKLYKDCRICREDRGEEYEDEELL